MLLAATFLLVVPSYPRQQAHTAPGAAISRIVALPSPIPPAHEAPAASPRPKPNPEPVAKMYEPKPETKAPAGSVQAEIVKAWPGNDDWALRIVRCETGSTWNPHAHNASSGADGLWQFIPSTWHRMLGQSGMPSHYSVEYQTKQAWRLFTMAGPNQWACN